MFGVLVSRETEKRVDVRRVHQRLRLIVEVVHVERDFAEGAGGAVGIELVQEVPAIAESRRAVRMRDRRQSSGSGSDLEGRVGGRKISGRRNADRVERDKSGQNVSGLARDLLFER